MLNSSIHNDPYFNLNHKLSDLDLEECHLPVTDAVITGALDVGPIITSDRIWFGCVGADRGLDDFSDAIDKIENIRKLLKAHPRGYAASDRLKHTIKRREQAEDLLSELDIALQQVRSAGSKITYSLNPARIEDENEFGHYTRDGWICTISIKNA